MLIRKTGSIGDSIVVVIDGEYAGVVLEAQLCKDIEGPEGVAGGRPEGGRRCGRRLPRGPAA